MKHVLILLAVVPVIIWVVGVTLAVTSVALHLLWVAAIVLAIIWLFGRLKS